MIPTILDGTSRRSLADDGESSTPLGQRSNQVNLDSSPPAHISWDVSTKATKLCPTISGSTVSISLQTKTLDASDILLDFTAPFAPQLALFQSYAAELNVTFPHVYLGTWYLIIAVDCDHLVEEASENDTGSLQI